MGRDGEEADKVNSGSARRTQRGESEGEGDSRPGQSRAFSDDSALSIYLCYIARCYLLPQGLCGKRLQACSEVVTASEFRPAVEISPRIDTVPPRGVQARAMSR